METPPNLLKFVHFTFIIIIIESIQVLFQVILWKLKKKIKNNYIITTYNNN